MKKRQEIINVIIYPLVGDNIEAPVEVDRGVVPMRLEGNPIMGGSPRTY